MSGGLACKCEQAARPVDCRLWEVWDRRCNHSAFNGYHRTYSPYSAIHCLGCGAIWRTKAGYVDQLPDGRP